MKTISMATAPNASGGAAFESAGGYAVARALLLHYAVLRGLVGHPLQRPMALTRGLAARPVTAPQPDAAGAG